MRSNKLRNKNCLQGGYRKSLRNLKIKSLRKRK